MCLHFNNVRPNSTIVNTEGLIRSVIYSPVQLHSGFYPSAEFVPPIALCSIYHVCMLGILYEYLHQKIHDPNTEMRLESPLAIRPNTSTLSAYPRLIFAMSSASFCSKTGTIFDLCIVAMPRSLRSPLYTFASFLAILG